jgi:hypothetical protein
MEEVTEIRNSAFFESKVIDLEGKNKSLAYDNAELSKENEDLRARVKQLATRQPQWPQGYRPRKHSAHK